MAGPRKRHLARMERLRSELSSDAPDVRAEAIRKATEHLRDEPWLLDTVRRLFREDPVASVRMSAVDPLRLAGAYVDVLDDFVLALRDPSPHVRRLVSLTFGGLPYLVARRVDALVDAARLPDAPIADIGSALDDDTFDLRIRERLVEADGEMLETLVALLAHMPERLRAIQSAPGDLSERLGVMERIDAIVAVPQDPGTNLQLGEPVERASRRVTALLSFVIVLAIAIVIAIGASLAR